MCKLKNCLQEDKSKTQKQLRLWFTTGVIEAAFGADQFAFAPFEQGAAVDAVLPIMKLLLLGQLLLLYFRDVVLVAHVCKVIISLAGINMNVSGIFSFNFYQANLNRAMPTAFTAHTILNGSLSVVTLGTSREEW